MVLFGCRIPWLGADTGIFMEILGNSKVYKMANLPELLPELQILESSMFNTHNDQQRLVLDLKS